MAPSKALACAFAFMTLAVFATDAAAAERLRLPGIKGADDRQMIDSAAYPWSAIGRVNRSTGGFCTGVAVGANQVLTAAHCLWNPRTQRFLPADSLHFLPGYRRGEFLTHARVVDFRISPDYSPPRPGAEIDIADDWALLSLDSDIEAVTPPLPIVRMEAGANQILQAGYSQDKAHILTVHADCSVLGIGAGERIFFHDCDATRGDSGSPVLVRRGDRFAVIGIHIATTRRNGEVVGISAAAWQALTR